MYRQNWGANDSRENEEMQLSWSGRRQLAAGRIPFPEMYIFDSQEKTDSRNTNRFHLCDGKIRGLRVNGGADG